MHFYLTSASSPAFQMAKPLYFYKVPIYYIVFVLLTVKSMSLSAFHKCFQIIKHISFPFLIHMSTTVSTKEDTELNMAIECMMEGKNIKLYIKQ